MVSELVEILVESLKLGDLSKLKRFVNDFIEKETLSLLDSLGNKERIETYYYLALSKFIVLKKFEEFIELFNYSDKFEIFIDVKKIPFRFKIISDLHLRGIQEGRIGNIFGVIKFFNQYNLFERNFSNEELELIENLKKDRLLVANLRDLFGRVSNSLIFYVCKIMPYDLYLIYVKNVNLLLNNEDRSYLGGAYNLNFLKEFTNRYSVYGLSVENLGDLQTFIDFCKNKCLIAKNQETIERSQFVRLWLNNKIHLVSINNILENYHRILDNKTQNKYYNLSMVLLGGIGPQGHGFTYSTPQGEVVEICSDIKENEAIIVKYKQFLRDQFLSRIGKELLNKGIDENTIQELQDYLSETINNNEKINFFKKDMIVEQIQKFLNKCHKDSIGGESDLLDLIRRISDAIKVILRPIKLVDQFKCRMDLVDENILKPEEIAKLTSLEGKSHFDVLRERFFFQNEINWFFKDYSSEINELQKKFLTF